MTQAVLSMTDQGALVELTGHARDERVCAAISTLCCAAMNSLDGLADGARYEPGNVYFAVHRPHREDIACLRMLAVGLSGLAENFPEDVDVTLCGEWAL